MTYKKYKTINLYALISFPILMHAAVWFQSAKGGYDGKHCAGLLDAVWECTELEYYIDYIFNPFSIISLAGYYAIAFVLFIISLVLYKKYEKNKKT